MKLEIYLIDEHVIILDRLQGKTMPGNSTNDKSKARIRTLEIENNRLKTELQESREQYNSLFMNNHTVMLLIEPDTGKIIEANPAAYAFYRYEKLAGMMFTGISTLQRSHVFQEMEQAINGLRNRYICRHRLADQEIRDVEIYSVPVKVRGRKLLYYIISDITKNQKADDELKRTSEQLSMLLESLPIVPFTCKAGEHYGITYVSSGIEEITGYAPDHFIVDSSFWEEHIHADDRQQVFAKLPELFEHEKFQMEYRFMISNGKYKWFSDTRRLVRDSGGEISRIAGTWQDITEEKKLRIESEYRMQQVIQADKLASLGEVVAGVAHEINNPNSFITYNIPLLEETWLMFEPIISEYAASHPDWRRSGLTIEELCQDMREIIPAIRTGSDRINKVVHNLKDFARMDESSQKNPVNINSVIEKTMMIVGAQVRKSVGTLHMELASDLPEINAHPQKLEQVIANLVMNAVKSIPDRDKGMLTITSRYIDRIRSILIEVEDNGIGIKSSELERIFEPFYTTRRETGGTGLGLSVSYGLIKEHNGVIGVLSRPNLGSRFIVFLPIGEKNNLDLRPSILCVDDDEQVLNMLNTYFVSVKNMSFDSLNSPENVISYLANHPEVDIVLSDIVMPKMSGWELIKKIKKKYPLLTIFLFSGFPEAIKQKPPSVPGPDYLMEKPLELKMLFETIKSTSRQRL